MPSTTFTASASDAFFGANVPFHSTLHPVPFGEIVTCNESIRRYTRCVVCHRGCLRFAAVPASTTCDRTVLASRGPRLMRSGTQKCSLNFLWPARSSPRLHPQAVSLATTCGCANADAALRVTATRQATRACDRPARPHATSRTQDTGYRPHPANRLDPAYAPSEHHVTVVATRKDP